MAEKQQQDQNHHISVLKEQVKARENKVSMLTADVRPIWGVASVVQTLRFKYKYQKSALKIQKILLSNDQVF